MEQIGDYMRKHTGILPRSSKTASESHSEIILRSSKTASGNLCVKKYECEVCRDAGFVHPRREDDSVDYRSIVPCKCKVEQFEAEREQAMLKFCQIPPGTGTWTFENFNVGNNESLTDAKAAAMQLADESGGTKWLTLVSKIDRGKSHLAIAVCRRWLARGKPARYALAPVLLDELRQGYNAEGDYKYDKWMSFLKNVPLLVIDDLGTEKPTAWALEKLMVIIDHRYVSGLPLMVTTNKSVNDLPGDDEGRIGSRLQREPFTRVVVIDAPEYRLRKVK